MTKNMTKNIVLVSACLVGLLTRYDGKSKKCSGCLAALADNVWIPVCPEQLGGLATPRSGADIVGGNGFDVLAGQARVIDRNGVDTTRSFVRGAEQVLAVAKAMVISQVYLKSRSPSCGLSPRPGVTAALLLKNGCRVREF